MSRLRSRMLMMEPVDTAFSPLSLSPILWLDANDISTLFTDSALTTPVTADADRVGGWKDKSGNVNHALQSSANLRGTYNVNIQNGLPAVSFDGTDDWLRGDLAFTGSAITLFIAGKFTESAGAVKVIFSTGGGDPATNGGVDVYLDDRGAGAQKDSFTFVYNTGTTGAANDKNIGVGKADSQTASSVLLDGSYSAANATYFKNATDQTPYDAFGTGVGVNAHVASALRYGIAALTDGTVPIASSWYEVLAFNSVLGDGNKGLIRTYLNSKWALY